MIKHILYATNGMPITLSKRRYLKAKHYQWHVISDGKGGKILVTYFNSKSHTFSQIVFGQRIRRKDITVFDYTKSNILGVGQAGRTARFPKYNNNTSGYKYVYKKGNKWSVSFRVNNDLHYKGSFSDIKDAAIVADYWAYRIAGINSYQNFKWPSRRTLAKLCREILQKNDYSIDDIIEI